ncbi:5-methylcytosine-specific restriction endonuclease system specificity protein McrC [candidate division KSB1 bacterium]
MAIPIQNIYYMLCYAWDKLDEANIVSVKAIDQHNIFDLLGQVLHNGISYLLRRGLDRGYIIFSEATSNIRGKIDISGSIKRNLIKQPKIICIYDEFNHNVLHNQILKSTIRMLLKYDELHKDISGILHFIYRKLHGIELIDLEKRHFDLVQLNRNNYFYDFLLKICELIYENLQIYEEEGKSKFRDFTRDKNKMRVLFEEFVRNFYKIHLSDAYVKKEQIDWDIKGFDEISDKYIPKMETDTSITFKDGKRKIVIETKFSKDVFQEHYNKESIKSPNLYQLYAYIKNLGVKDDYANKHCEGILLYPQINYKVDLRYKIEEHKFSVKTLDLNQDWKKIRTDLLKIIN